MGNNLTYGRSHKCPKLLDHQKLDCLTSRQIPGSFTV